MSTLTPQISHYYFDPAVNATFATVRTPYFSQTFFISGRVTEGDFLKWVQPTIDAIHEDLAKPLEVTRS